MADQPLILLGVASLVLPLALLSLRPASALRYLQRKRYQYEVTFSLYMMTPTEKFIFNSILFLFVAMVLIAAALYLPANVVNLAKRAGYYIGGDDVAAASTGAALAVPAETSAVAEAVTQLHEAGVAA
ncbi:hypothetical protein ANO11243_016390 [Dothideomycetidae sp. 11243]|nr:hypothetical protein ANO11243_016390 [fungal sp. No.11243]